MTRWTVAVATALVAFLPLFAADDPSASEAAIKEAITILEARKAQASDPAEQERIGRAVTALEKLLPKNEAKKAPNKVDPLKVPPAVLAKKFHGKPALNPKTGELTLVYDFKTADPLKDFDLKEAKPTAKGGVLNVAAADSIQHVVRFKSVTVSGKFTVGNVAKEQPLIGTEAATIWYWEFNGLNVAVNAKGQRLAEKYFDRVPFANVAVQFTVNDKKALATVRGADIAAPIMAHGAGRVTLFGGSGGVQISALVISGVPEEDWAADFFAR